VVEVAVLALLSVPHLREWVETSFRPLRVLLAAVAVVGFSALVFHPPNLAWFDAKVTYAYRIEVDTVDGDTLVVEPRDLSPYVQELAFSMIRLGPTRPAAGPYGAADRTQLDRLAPVTDIDELAAVEATLASQSPVELTRAAAFLVAFVSASHRGDPSMPVPSAPHEFQIDLGGPRYGGEAIERLRVTRVTTFRGDDGPQVRRERALEIEMVDGEPTIVG